MVAAGGFKMLPSQVEPVLHHPPADRAGEHILGAFSSVERGGRRAGDVRDEMPAMAPERGR